MTMGVIIGTSQYAAVVTDRQRTWSTKTKSQDATKCGVARFQDGRVAYTIAGLYNARNFYAEQWVPEALVRAAKASEIPNTKGLSLETSLGNFRDAATARFRSMRSVRAADKRMSIAFAGFRDSPFGGYQSVIAIVSNFEHPEFDAPDTIWDEFKLWFRAGNTHGFGGVMVIGAGRPTPEEIRDRGETVLTGKVPPAEAINVGRRMIEVARARDKTGTIGEETSSVIVFPDARLPNAYDYDSADVGPSTFYPAFAYAVYGPTGAAASYGGRKSAFEGETTAPNFEHVPKPRRRNDPCKCRSGKRYRDCHGDPKRPAPENLAFQVGFHVLMIEAPAEGYNLPIMAEL